MQTTCTTHDSQCPVSLQSRRMNQFRRATERGVTLVEVLIVVAIVAMVAGGVAVFAFPRFKEAQVKTAGTGALTIRQAAQTWQASGGDGCPTVSQLVQEKYLDPGANTQDPWGGDYTITCTDDEVIVSSTGPDQQAGSKDDIQVPKNLEVDES